MMYSGNQKLFKVSAVTAIALVITIPLQIILSANSSAFDGGNTLDSPDDLEHIGINMRGNYTAQTQYRDVSKEVFPQDYYDQSFRIISNSGINFVRYLFFWEAYEKNPTAFLEELKTVAKMADKWKVNVVYTSDNYATSSYLDPKYGYGFPSSLFDSNTIEKGSGGGFRQHNIKAKLWWTKLWDRSLKSINGTDAWTLQANFLKRIVSTVDKHNTTMGYEILNEPHVYYSDQWEKIGNFNTFITNELRSMTNKLIFYDRQVPSDLYGYLNISAQNIAKMAPSNKTNVIFKATIFNTPTNGSYAENKVHTYAKAANLADVPLCLCEFNVRGVAAGPVKQSNIILSTDELSQVIQKLQELEAWGLAIWIWDYKPRANYNFNMVSIINGTVIPTENFRNIISAISLKNSGTPTQTTDDTINPVANVTGVFIINKTNISSDPIPSKSTTSNLVDRMIVKGEAFDIGSGIKSVNVRVNNESYVLANQTNHGDWLNWQASLVHTIKENNTINIRSEDKAGIVENTATLWKLDPNKDITMNSPKPAKSFVDNIIDFLKDIF